MMQLWQSLNWPQAMVLAIASAALLAGAVPMALQCATHFLETLICAIAGGSVQKGVVWLNKARRRLATIHRRPRREAA